MQTAEADYRGATVIGSRVTGENLFEVDYQGRDGSMWTDCYSYRYETAFYRLMEMDSLAT